MKPANKQTEALLRRVGYTHLKKKGLKSSPGNPYPDYKVKKTIPLSNHVDQNGFRRCIDDHRWRRDSLETQATIEEIERKKKSVAVAYNKGPAMLITPGTSAADLGKK